MRRAPREARTQSRREPIGGACPPRAGLLRSRRKMHRRFARSGAAGPATLAVRMKRPRWHDVLITLALLGVAAAGVWAFWGDDVARALGVKPDRDAAPAPRPSAAAS